MGQLRHTRGPWEVCRDPVEVRCMAVRAIFEYEPGEFASLWVARELDKKNAQLVSAAPDLLAACEAGIAALRCHIQPGTFRDKADEALDLLRAAIAKATGEGPTDA